MSDILAIVGSTTFANPNWERIALAQIRAEVTHYDKPPAMIISGGADGIDKLAERYANEHGIDFRDFLPKYRRWEPEGFKARNMIVGATCTRLLAIRCILSRTYGSGWTADYAEKLGRPVRRRLISATSDSNQPGQRTG